MVEDGLHLGGAKPSAAARIDGGTAFSAARVAMMMVGSVISVSTRPPTSAAERGRPAKLMKDGEAQQTVDDRGNGGEVVDVDLDQVRQAVLRGDSSR